MSTTSDSEDVDLSQEDDPDMYSTQELMDACAVSAGNAAGNFLKNRSFQNDTIYCKKTSIFSKYIEWLQRIQFGLRSYRAGTALSVIRIISNPYCHNQLLSTRT